ncbi:metallopeptidase TldD-related protein [Saccharothrix obliqua]|uniref:metallopeptidase TldD-related protein n=1 Tax=Saccharothrix obliqua TaxID=2861747 RepID=UPI001C5E209A|nr:metallopeptidase TldD-related protein [Saccharothrix obliqua]MBW4722488.1 TldD/PmbA family protein [Saccharothrix obliqua]
MIPAHEVVERALAAASRGDGVVVVVDETARSHLRWSGDAATSAGHVLDRRVHVAVVTAGGTAGVVSASGALDVTAVRGLVADAAAAARRSGAEAGAAPLVAADRPPSPDWHDPPVVAPPGALGRLAAEVATAARRAAARGRVLHGYAEHEVRTTLLGTTTGLRLRHVRPTALVDLTGRDDRLGASSWASAEVDDPAGLDLAGLLADVDRRLDLSARRVRARPGRHEVLLPPSCAADLMRHLYQAAGARDAHAGRGAFGGKLGTRLSGLPLTLRSDPVEPGVACEPFVVARASGADTAVSDNGLALRPTSWISDGVLTALVHTRASADRAGVAVTPRVGNLVLDGPPGGRSTTELVESTADGLLLTSLWYLREVDPRTLRLTGLTRDGVHLVRDGEVVAAVDDFRFDESPLHLLDRVTEVGRTTPAPARERDDEERTRTAMPPLRVADFAVAGPAA